MAAELEMAVASWALAARGASRPVPAIASSSLDKVDIKLLTT
jgi:hypothetical protein